MNETPFASPSEPRSESRPAGLVAALEPGAGAAEPTPRRRLRIVLLVIAAVLSGAAGLISFAAFTIAPDLGAPCGFFNTTVGGYPEHMDGGKAFAVLAGLALWATAVSLAARHLDRLRYLLIPLGGFVVSYAGILLAITEVAKAIWGPAQCQ